MDSHWEVFERRSDILTSNMWPILQRLTECWSPESKRDYL